MSKESTIEYLRKKALLLPKSPGVYIMENRDGKVIYVGKSRALKNRVTSYFHGAHNIKTDKMVSHVADFRYITCDTEMEALVLENNLIKQYTPKYNILLKDAKSYPYIKVTLGEEFPRVVPSREMKKDKSRYFGPYTSMAAVKDVVELINKLFGLRTCRKNLPRDFGKDRPCLQYHMKQCTAPCTGCVPKEEYKEQEREEES